MITDPTKPAVVDNTAFGGPNVTQAAAGNTALGITPSAPIDVSKLGTASPFTLPPAPVPTPYDLGSLPDISSLLNPAPTATETAQTGLQDKLLTDTKTIGGKPAAQITAEANAGLPGFQSQLTDINSQIQTLTKENAAIPLQVQNEFNGRAATAGGVAPIQNERTRDNTIKALGLSAIAQTLQGNIATAQQTANRAVELQFAPVQAEIDYLTKALDINKDNLSREDQKRADVLQVQIGERQRLLDDQKADKTTILGWAAEAAKNGAGSVTLNQALALSDPSKALSVLSGFLSDPVAKQQALANLELTRSQTAKNRADAAGSGGAASTGDFAATIDLAAQADKRATNSTKASVKQSLQSSIAAGDYKSAYQTIVQQTKAGLTGTNATTFENAANLGSTLSDLQTALQSYANAGGDTNILKGNLDTVGNKIGTLINDPKYKAIAVQLDTAFQNYRHVMTGANFSAAESNSYASVLPSKNNTIALNLATIEGAKAAANSTVEANIKNVVGQGGVYIKQYADGATPPAQTAPADPVFTSWLKANGL